MHTNAFNAPINGRERESPLDLPHLSFSLSLSTNAGKACFSRKLYFVIHETIKTKEKRTGNRDPFHLILSLSLDSALLNFLLRKAKTNISSSCSQISLSFPTTYV
jgi:hypothetical protein